MIAIAITLFVINALIIAYDVKFTNDYNDY